MVVGSTVSSSTTSVWWRAVANILVVKELFTADVLRMVRHNLVPQARRRESSLNYSQWFISEATSRRAPSADEHDKLQTFYSAFSWAWWASISSPLRRATLQMRPLASPQTNTNIAMLSTSRAHDDPFYDTGMLAPPRSKPYRNRDEWR
jgi:hypothetical protein